MNEKSSKAIHEKIQKLAMVFQPIWKITPNEAPVIKTYELLLRYGEGVFFPIEVFNELTDNQVSCDELNLWYEKKLTEYLETYPESYFNLNIDMKQMRYQSTWDLLANLSHFKHRLCIELTEFYQVSTSETKRLFDETMVYIRKLGLDAAFDDVGNGIHSVSFVSKNIHHVNSIKISLLNLLHLDPETMGLVIDVWVRVAKVYGVSFIVEAVETKEMADLMTSRGIMYQQGFYWSKPLTSLC